MLTEALVTLGITGLVGSAVLVGLTLDLVATNVGVTGVTSVLGRAGAEGLVVHNPAGGLGRAVANIAWIQALLGLSDRVVEAGKLGLALAVAAALVRGLAAKHGVLHHVGGAGADVRSRDIGAPHVGEGTYVVLALINVLAAVGGEDVAGLALAPA